MQPSKVYTREEVINFLLFTLKQPVLPVAPQQDPYKPNCHKVVKSKIIEENGVKTRVSIPPFCLIDENQCPVPRFTGKNPSFLNWKGEPQIVWHQNYQDLLPATAEIQKWFANPHVGLGTLGGWNNIIWIDLDVKQFSSQQELDIRFNQLLEKSPPLKDSWTERTHSGGYRLAVKPKEKPDFTNFSLDEVGGKHHGEALGAGRFTVLAPTVGVSGNRYECLNLAVPVEIDSLESIGIYPVSEKKEKTTGFKKAVYDKDDIETGFSQNDTEYPYRIEVRKLLSNNASQVLAGENIKSDRSASLTLLIQEIAGWENQLNSDNIGVSDNLNYLVFEAGEALGLESDRLVRIFDTVNTANCKPSIWFVEGSKGCWKKIKTVDEKIFDALCPVDIKEEIKNPRYIYQVEGKTFESSKPVNLGRLTEWIKSHNFTPTISINKLEFSFPDIPKLNAIIGVNSSMGTGKTQESLREVKRTEQENQVCCLWLAPRVKLLIQTVTEAGKKEIKIYLLNEDDGIELIADSSIHQALCPESIHKIDGYATGRDIWIDEATSAFSQILSGGTVSGNAQGLCLEVLKNSFAAANRVFLLDANLRDLDIDLVAKFAPEKEVIKILNECPVRKAKITIVQGIMMDEDGNFELKKKDKSNVVAKLLKANEIPIVATDSKNLSKDLEILFTAHGKWGFTLNRESSEETWEQLFIRCPNVKAAIENKKTQIDLKAKWAHELLEAPNTFFIKFKPEFFVYSPTAESGVSITLNKNSEYYFTVMAAFFVGTIGINSQTQMLFRYRDTEIPRYVFCPEKGFKPQGSCEPTVSLMAQALADEIKILRELNEYRSLDYLAVYEKAFTRLNKTWMSYSLTIDNLVDFEKTYLRDCLIYKLKEIGHEIEVVQEEQLDQINEILKDIRADNRRLEATEIFEAVPFEDIDQAKQAYKKNPDKFTARRKEKTRILHELPGIENSEIWSINFIESCFITKPKMLDQLKKFWLLFNADVESKSNEYWDYLKLSSEFTTIKAVKNDIQLTLWGLRELKIDQLIKTLVNGYEFSNSSPEILES
jgi:hypothetical protein